MRRKICMVIVTLILMVFAAFGFCFVLDNMKPPVIEEPMSTEEPSESEVELPNSEVVVEPEVEEDKEIDFDFDAIVIENRDEQGFIDDSKDVAEVFENETYMVATDFSNGFIATTTEHATAISNLSGYAEYACADGSIVTVFERDALECSIQTLREDLLNRVFPTYMYYEPSGCSRDDTVLGTGLKSKENVFAKIPTDDVTFEGNTQLLADTTITTALGNGLLVEYYSPRLGQYHMYAYIQCDRDRVIEVKALSYDEKNILDYIVEITNEGIYLIK